jgi:hypothetical protein
MIRQVSWSEVPARTADVPARAERRLPVPAGRSDNNPTASAANLVERIQVAIALAPMGRPGEARG